MATSTADGKNMCSLPTNSFRSAAILLTLVLLCWLTIFYHYLVHTDPVVYYNRQQAGETYKFIQLLSKNLTLPINNAENLMAPFKPLITAQQKTMFMESLAVLTSALDSAGIMYYMYGGTLIGSWRHHDMVPWDDDVDIVLNSSDQKAIQALKFEGYTLDSDTPHRYKLFSNKAKPIDGYPHWKWPYIDICFFVDTGTHLHDMDPARAEWSRVRKSLIVPLTKRPFGNLTLKAPRDTGAVVKDSSTMCQTRAYDHMHQRSVARENVHTVDCRMLYSMYPFVKRERSSSNSTSTEKLFLDGKLLNVVELPLN